MILNILSRHDVTCLPEADRVHLLAEAAKTRLSPARQIHNRYKFRGHSR